MLIQSTQHANSPDFYCPFTVWVEKLEEHFMDSRRGYSEEEHYILYKAFEEGYSTLTAKEWNEFVRMVNDFYEDKR